MVHKRYTERQATALLARIVAITDAPVTRARRVVNELARARLSDVVVSDSASEMVGSASDAEISALQRGLHTLLQMQLEVGGHAWPPVKLQGVTLTMSGPNDVRVEVSGPLRTVISLQAYSLLRLVGSRLMICRAPRPASTSQCGRLFVRSRRQLFCSERCQKRVYMRRHRAGEAGKE